MSTAAPLQNTAAKSRQFSNSSNAGLLLQRKCACGDSAGLGGQCDECQAKKLLGLQTKLAVGEPGDVYEQEADRIADQVMATPARPAVSGASPRIQRFSGQSNGQLDAAPASVDQALTSPGRPLEPALRQDMEQRFGHDFSRVRVHSGAAAEQSAQDVNAHSYTVGNSIVFGAGRFSPGTDEGRRLLAHELTHVVQQSGSDGLRADESNEKRGLSPVSLQDRHALRRRVIADVLTTSVGEFYVQELTPDELRTEAALVVGALGAQTLSDKHRQLLESNLQTLEDYASTQGVDLAAATAYRLRQVITALFIDLKGLGSELKDILRIKVMGQEVGADFPNFSPFLPEVVWNQQQLSWAADAVFEAGGLTATAEAGGAQSMQQFRAAGTRVTAALFESQAAAIHLAYLHAGVVAASDFIGPGQPIASKVRMVREELEPMLQELRSLDPSRVERAVTKLQSPWHSFQTDFNTFVEELEEHAHTLKRIRQVVSIIELAMLARGLMRPRPGGGPPIAGGPGISRATAGGVAVARGTVGSVEWLESMRRLAAIGAISTAAAVGRIGGGTAGALPMPAKPTLTAAAQVKPTGTPAPTSTGGTPTATGGATAPVQAKPMSKAEFDRLPYAERQKLLDEWMKQRGVGRIIDSNDHHAWPKYLEGPEKGPLIGLDEQLHRAFHSALDKELPRRLGTAYYATLSQGQKIRNIKILKQVVKDFDMQWGTKIYDRLSTAMKGTPYADVPIAP